MPTTPTPDPIAALAAAVQTAERAILGETGSPAMSDPAVHRALDAEPCPSCGGDRLRQDFTRSGRCHAGGRAVLGETANEDRGCCPSCIVIDGDPPAVQPHDGHTCWRCGCDDRQPAPVRAALGETEG